MKNTLDLLIQLAHGVSTQFGSNCEIVIHDLTKDELQSSIVYIENGQISDRKIGDAPSAIVIESLHKNPDSLQDQLSYLTKTKDGHILKSSTMYIRDDDNKIHYIFSINYNITELIGFDHVIHSFIETNTEKDAQPKEITHNVYDLLDDLIEQSVALIGKPVALMTKNEKVTAIQFLNTAGAFLITKSGDIVSSFFGISKFTLYSYMDTNK